MSEEQLKAFLAKVQADASLQEQLKAEGADVVAIAKAAGFSITTEDLNSHRQIEMTDDELEGVAGGGCGLGARRETAQCWLSH
ncbi:possible (M20568) ORF 11 [Azotobacter vinelandii] [Prochlorococcus marinus str. MIT 9313]|uniref:Possible (M20568) ORF 11 [Azotobacter vinelandii] n=1 Tax=Prochlorococcus marinus (strain MIT 9313) TaxID=74547 RepID=Q7V440_PROMM|nr:Nif11-like leader peptide family natural product precursor [Prochlorococcus marinus]CAE22304.1 possible (M20568) ORF 11 [Azotobacter vinelandii] [Prochlorococcus marinus str. MIT 9313]